MAKQRKKSRLPKRLIAAYTNYRIRKGIALKGLRRAARRDRRKRAKVAPSYKAWKRNPVRYDWPGIDLPGTYKRRRHRRKH